jgi:hypothetical protein
MYFIYLYKGHIYVYISEKKYLLQIMVNIFSDDT